MEGGAIEKGVEINKRTWRINLLDGDEHIIRHFLILNKRKYLL